MQLERGDINEKPRADELFVQMVVAKDVAHVLAKKTLDALPKLLDAVHIFLRHPPGTIGCIGRSRLEFFDALFDRVVPRDIGNKVFDYRESFDRLDRDGLIQWNGVEPRHAHQTRLAVDFRRTRTAFARLA